MLVIGNTHLLTHAFEVTHSDSLYQSRKSAYGNALLCFCQILGGGLKSKNTMNINLVGRETYFNMGFNVKNQVLSCNTNLRDTLIFTSPLEIVLIVNAARNFLYQAFPSTYKLRAAL